MATTQELLSEIVSDFDAVYRAYERAGLLAGEAHTEAAKQLLGGGDDLYRFKREFLLVEALLRNRVGRLVYGSNELQHIAVFGGNNVGKSTVVNILAGEEAASTSPQGGHTQHAQAFFSPLVQKEGSRLFGNNPYVFHRFHSAPIAALDRAQFNQYGEGRLTLGVLPEHVVLWDMPDSDSTESRKYMPAVVEVVALADVIVYVTSVEKYAVSHMVEWIFLLHEAGIAFLECLNKTRQRDQAEVIRSQRTKHFPEMARQLGLPAPDPPIVGLRYLVEGKEQDLWGPHHPEAAELRSAVLEMLQRSDRVAAGVAALTFCLQRIERLLEPARMEVLATEQWAVAVENAVQDFSAVYEQEYLQSDKVIDPFNRVNLEILNLLDPNIPGLHQASQAIRWITRWPARLVLTIGRRVFSLLPGDGEKPINELPPELKAYSDAHMFVLNKLGAMIDSASKAPRRHPFWDALSAAWTGELKPLSEQFGERIRRHMAETDAEVKKTAREIYQALEQQPFLLNALRGVRVTANVAGAMLGFVIPHGGGGVVLDLLEEAVLAPLLMTGVEAATAGAVESFVSDRRRRLVEKLRRDARHIAAELYREPLVEISNMVMKKTGVLGVDKEMIERLPDSVKQLHAQLGRI